MGHVNPRDVLAKRAHPVKDVSAGWVLFQYRDYDDGETKRGTLVGKVNVSQRKFS